jgi:CPA2 family monovalent cation:H+ antiporter-2
MDDVPFLRDMAIVAAVAVGAVVLMARLRLPTVTGLLLAGAIVGPYSLGLVDDPSTLRGLAEVGVVLLLFTIGLEITPERLLRIARLIAGGGALQVGLTVTACVGVAALMGRPVTHGLFMGFVLALSSTAIVLQVLSERGEVEAPHGRFVLATLLFQDLAFVPMGLIVPLLGDGERGVTAGGIALALAKAGGVVGGAVLVSRAVLPRLFARVDATRSREAFLMAVVAVCIGTAWVTSLAGLSLALGAFLAGLVVAGTDYAHRALGDVLPLRSVLTSLFFVSLGTLFDASVLIERPLAVGLLLVALVPGKALLATLAALVMRVPARVALTAGAGLAQFGEFGFVLAGLGAAAGLVSPQDTKVLLAAGVLSMFVAPLVIRGAPHLGVLAPLFRPLERLFASRAEDPSETPSRRSKHVIVVGYGVAGRVLVDALRRSGVPYEVLELNAATVRAARDGGDPHVTYADATSGATLAHARVDAARAVAVLINDYAAVRRVVAAVHRHAPNTPVFARARHLADREPLLSLGATEVVAEEVEAGIEMLARVLDRLGLTRTAVDDHVREAREFTLTARPFRAPADVGGVPPPEK